MWPNIINNLRSQRCCLNQHQLSFIIHDVFALQSEYSLRQVTTKLIIYNSLSALIQLVPITGAVEQGSSKAATRLKLEEMRTALIVIVTLSVVLQTTDSIICRVCVSIEYLHIIYFKIHQGDQGGSCINHGDRGSQQVDCGDNSWCETEFVRGDFSPALHRCRKGRKC